MSRVLYGSLQIANQGQLQLQNSGSTFQTNIQALAGLGASYTLTLPSSAGSASQLLATDGTGALSFTLVADANVSASAAIALSKLAALTTNRALQSDGSGLISVSATTSTELGYLSGVTSAIQTQLGGKASTALSNLTVSGLTTGDLLYASSSSALTRLAVGSTGQVLGVSGGVPAWQAAQSSVKANWVAGDGTTKTITHNLGSLDVIVQLYDKTDGTTIEVNSAARTDSNTLTLTSNQAPGAAGWRVLILTV